MKRCFYIAFGFLTGASVCSAAVTLDSLFGPLFNASGNAVPDGTLWVLVADSDVDSSFGVFDIDENLYDANTASPGVADLYFTTGQSISLGNSLADGTVFAMGEVNGALNALPGAITGPIEFDLGANGAASNRAFAVFFFPGATFSGDQNNAQTISNQVGGFHTSSDDGGIFDIGMILPADGNYTAGATNADGGGTFANRTFTAVFIPEPSTAFLAAIGSLVLLRRRRN